MKLKPNKSYQKKKKKPTEKEEQPKSDRWQRERERERERATTARRRVQSHHFVYLNYSLNLATTSKFREYVGIFPLLYIIQILYDYYQFL